MDKNVGVGMGPAERHHDVYRAGPVPEPWRRMSRPRKREAVLRLLRGEDLETVSRSLGVTAAALTAWRDAFLAAGEAALATRPADGETLASERLKARLGEMLLRQELLEEKIAALEAGRPLARRRPRR